MGPDQVPDGYLLPYASTKDQYRRTFSGMLAALDEGVGNVTKALKAKGMWNNTFLVLQADNGGPTDMCMKTGTQNKPLRGGKCSVWEGGTRGTALVSGGFLPSGVVGKPFPNLMHTVDWLPTLAALAGVPESRKEIFYGFAGGDRSGAAIRTDKWKLLQGKPYDGAPVPFPSFYTPNHTRSLSTPTGITMVETFVNEEGLEDEL